MIFTLPTASPFSLLYYFQFAKVFSKAFQVANRSKYTHKNETDTELLNSQTLVQNNKQHLTNHHYFNSKGLAEEESNKQKTQPKFEVSLRGNTVLI